MPQPHRHSPHLTKHASYEFRAAGRPESLLGGVLRPIGAQTHTDNTRPLIPRNEKSAVLLRAAQDSRVTR